MTTDEYIILVYKNLKREISSEEFDLLNKVTLQDDSYALLRDEIEETWDLTGPEAPLSSVEDTHASFERLLQKKEHNTSSVSDKQTGEAKIIGFKKYQKYISGIAAILILSFGVWWFNQDASDTFQGGNNGLAITLDDKSSIYLAANSVLEVKSFGDTREMTLHGKAQFEVTPDTSRPFIVHTKNSRTEVLGTKFILQEATQLSKVILQVEEGKVRFSDSNLHQQSIVVKDETAVLLDEKISKITRLDNLKANPISMLRYEEANLRHVIDEIMIIFNKEIILENSNLNDCVLSGTLPAKNIDIVLKYIAKQFNLKVEQSGNTRTLIGGNCQ